jgi:ATP-binding cassette subfamily F protein 3
LLTYSRVSQRQHFTYVDPVVTAYISGLVEDEDEQVEDIIEQTKGMLEDATVDEKDLNAL